MWRRRFFACLAIGLLLAVGWFGVRGARYEPPTDPILLMKAKDFEQAFPLLRARLLDSKRNSVLAIEDFRNAWKCWQELEVEVDWFDLRDQAVKVHGRDWRFLEGAVRTLFEKPEPEPEPEPEPKAEPEENQPDLLDIYDRPIGESDRRWALGLLNQGLANALKDRVSSRKQVARYCMLFASILSINDHSFKSSQLYELTNLDPPNALTRQEQGEWNEFEPWGDWNFKLPMDSKGQPRFPQKPKTLASAQSDGERWRYLLDLAAEIDPETRDEVRYWFAQSIRQIVHSSFNHQQFGYKKTNQDQLNSDSPLNDNETMAWLASGRKRISLPDEFNYIQILQDIAKSRQKTNPRLSAMACDALADIYGGRGQYSRAAEQLRLAISLVGPGPKDHRTQSLKTIVEPSGQWESVENQPAGRPATLPYRVRNSKRVQFQAFSIPLDRYFSEAKTRLLTKPQPDWPLGFFINPWEFGTNKATDLENPKSLVASWNLDLKPDPNHKDVIVNVVTPLRKAGAYLLKAVLENGDTKFTTLFISDLTIVEQDLGNRILYYVCDTITGHPVPNAQVEFCRIYHDPHSIQPGFRLDPNTIAATTDRQGIIVFDRLKMPANDSWIAKAHSGDKRAYLCFHQPARQTRQEPPDSTDQVFLVTDRPIYRPGQIVYFKAWLRSSPLNPSSQASVAKKSLALKLFDGLEQETESKPFVTDDEGEFHGSFMLTSQASLGSYRLEVTNHGRAYFEVEEYRKPEFEVLINTPQKPIKRGEPLEIAIKANYYYGAPVTNAQVSYHVTRFRRQRIPTNWGLFWTQSVLPLRVQQGQGSLSENGTFLVTIPSVESQALSLDEVDEYEIQAEVRDESRRVVQGVGSFKVAESAFQVQVACDRGHYQLGQPIQTVIQAVQTNGQPVSGKAKIRVFQIRYDLMGKREEVPFTTQDIEIRPNGPSSASLFVRETGQYRVSCLVTDQAGNQVEASQRFLVSNDQFTGQELQFDNLELTFDKNQYQLGEKARLLINTSQPGQTVVVCSKSKADQDINYQVLFLKDKSRILEIPIGSQSKSSIAVKAILVSDARIITNEIRAAIMVPDTKIHVSVKPGQSQFRPGEMAKLQIQLTNASGQPLKNSAAITVYDQSLDAVAGKNWPFPPLIPFWPDDQVFFAHTYGSLSYDHANSMYLRYPHRIPFDSSGWQESVIHSPYFEQWFFDSMGVPHLRFEYNSFMGMGMAGMGGGGMGGVPNARLAKLPIRTDFADTAYWNGALITNDKGLTEVEFKLPDNLTKWKARVWTIDKSGEIGEGTAEFSTSKNLLVRLQTPRHLIVKDEAVITVNVHNGFKTDKLIKVTLGIDGTQPVLLKKTEGDLKTVLLKAGQDERLDWKVKAVRPGSAKIRVQALTDEESDTMELSVPVHVHGQFRTESFTRVMRLQDQETSFTINIPANSDPEQTQLDLRLSPRLAATLVDALPYLAEYPYGCTEQTLNRFLPIVVVQNTLKQLRWDLPSLRDHGLKGTRRAVFDPQELNPMAKVGLDKLAKAQLSDGGWDWFSGSGAKSSPYMTALVVNGLLMAREHQLEIHRKTIANRAVFGPESVIELGIEWLEKYQAQQVSRLAKPDDTDALVLMVLSRVQHENPRMLDLLYRDRASLSVFGQVLLGMALKNYEDNDKLSQVLRDLQSFVVVNPNQDSASLKLPNPEYSRFWFGNIVETHAFYLQLLIQADPKNPLIAQLANHLLDLRQNGLYWTSTRDTAFCVEALAAYLRMSKENSAEMTVEIWIDGQKQQTRSLAVHDLSATPFILKGRELPVGKHVITIRKAGQGVLRLNLLATHLPVEDRMAKSGQDLQIDRRYYKLEPQAQTHQFQRTPLADLASIKSGDWVEVELTLTNQEVREYLLIEDPKPAGFEIRDARSGYRFDQLWRYAEFRDDKAIFFISQLPKGQRKLTYRLRAETPGQFSALPATISAIYSPEPRANSEEFRIRVED